MSYKIIFLRSPTAGNIPTLNQLDLGILSINMPDGKLFLRKGTGAVTDIVIDLANPTIDRLPLSVQNSPYVLSVPGTMINAMVLWTIPITQPTQIPANLVGTFGYARTVSAANTIFTLSYIRNSTTTVITTFSFNAGSHNLNLSTSAVVNLIAGDTLLLDGPVTADTTLASFGITIPTFKS